jgi:hypothetical protein
MTSGTQILPPPKVSCHVVVHLSGADCSMAKIERDLDWYHFIGRIFGRAMYEGTIGDVAFADFFLAKVSKDPLFKL